MAKRKLSQTEKWRTGFRIFKKEFNEKYEREFKRDVIRIIEILEQLNEYNHEKDTLGQERVKSEGIRELINSLKGDK